MSHTVAFFLADICDKWLAIQECAEKFGLRAVRGIEAGDEEVVPGITTFISREQKTLEVVYIASDPDVSQSYAYKLYQETLLFRAHRRSPRLFPFLREISNITRELGNERYFLSCGEWAPNDDVLYLEGSVENLIDYVTTVQILGLWLWSPQTGDVQGSDRYPLLFRFVES